MTEASKALADRIAAYLDDTPHVGGHSDAAGANCWELLEEAMNELRSQPSTPDREELSQDTVGMALDTLGRSLVKKKLSFECCAVYNSPVACATNGYCAKPKREYKSEIESVGWAILQALHEGVEGGPQSWSDMASDQEKRIKKAAVAAIEAVTDLSQYTAQGFSLTTSHEAPAQEPVAWQPTAQELKRELRISSDHDHRSWLDVQEAFKRLHAALGPVPADEGVKP